MQQSSSSIGALAAALAKAQIERAPVLTGNHVAAN
jgi:hypothetical protein